MAEIETFQGFFSYARHDAETDPKLIEALTKRLEKRVSGKLTNARFAIWRDVNDIRTGERWDERIGEAVRTSHVFIVLMTPKWFESTWCRKEYLAFEEVEPEVGEYVVPLLARPIDRQLENFDQAQSDILYSLAKRQYGNITASDFLTLSDDARDRFIDKIADDIEAMIERLRGRGRVLRPPFIPTQGYGPHFEVGDDGIITFAPPDALDREGNHVARLRKLHPTLRSLSSALVDALGKGNIAHGHLRDRADAYRTLVDQDLEEIDFAVLYVEGVNLANADTATFSDKELPHLTPRVRAAIDTLLQVHGTFILSTYEGQELLEAEARYRRTATEETAYRTAAVGLANSLQNRPDVIDPKVASFIQDTVKQIGSGDNPQRSGTVATGTVMNVVITVSTAASLCALSAAAVASGSLPVMFGTGATVLVVGEGLKKSKSFATVAALVTKGIDNVSELDVAIALKDMRERFKPQLQFVRESDTWLRGLADKSASELSWVVRFLDWIKLPATIQVDKEVRVSKNRSGQPGNHFRDLATGPEMIVVPAGSFQMGSADGEGNDNERPRHKVTIARPFAVGRFAVTFEEWDAAYAQGGVKHNPNDFGWGRGRQPVIDVSWEDAKAYVAWLARETGKDYRLLSEAEWEYCCRAGTDSPFWCGKTISTSQANYDGNLTYDGGSKGEYRKQTVPVDSFAPNPWGLYQVHGNVSEWCEDVYAINLIELPEDGEPYEGAINKLNVKNVLTTSNVLENRRVLRGGCWSDGPGYLRSAARNRNRPDGRSDYTGFRVARTL